MSRASSAGRQRGFTLVEVMISLAILAFALVSLLVFTANNVFQTARVGSENVAVDLARGKMYDLEEELFTDGFQQLDQNKEGDFSDEGWPEYKWTAKVEKIELPDLGALQGMGAQGEAGEAGEAATGPGGAAGSPLSGLLGMAGGGADATGGTAGDAMISGQFEIIRNVLEEAIRKITLEVTWTSANEAQSLVLSYYVTDPSAVNRAIPGSGGAGEEGGEAEGDGAGSGATRPTGPGGTGTGRGGTRGGRPGPGASA